MSSSPTGVAIATALRNEGPLITSISVDVGGGGVKTTVKLDLYTAQYGKLQKQKEGAIAQIARDRQKITDQANNAIRRGFGKNQSNKNLVDSLLTNGGQKILDIVKGNELFYTEAQKRNRKGQVFVLDDVGGHIMDEEAFQEAAEQLPPQARAGEFNRILLADGGGVFSAGSEQEGDPYMNSTEYIHPRSVMEVMMPLNDEQNFA